MLLLASDDNEVRSPEIEVLLAALDSYTNRLEPHHPLVIDVVARLAIAFWRDGEVDRAIGLLDQTLEQLAVYGGPDHPLKAELLGILWKIMFEAGQTEQAGLILGEVLVCRLRHAGASHPDTLATQGDLAYVLFELGQHEEAELMEREAFEVACTNLGKTHSVTCVLAWHRMLSLERNRELDAARRIARDELLWLLAADAADLHADQQEIRARLAERVNWDSAARF